MKDFDGDRLQRLADRERRFSDEGIDRTFQIGGEVFTHRLVFPFAAVDAIFGVHAESSPGFVTDRLNAALRLIVEPGEKGEAHARLDKLKHELEVDDLQSVAFWIMAQLANRPTRAPSSSGSGRGANGTGSTDDSSSEVAEPEVSPA